MKESRSKKYLYKTKDTMIDIFDKIESNGLDALTDDELVKLFTFGTAINVMADEEYEERHHEYEFPDIYELSWKYIDQVLG